jgi:DNA-binding LytR/AlgR family response regulator
MNGSPSYLIAEDEPLLAQALVRMLAEHWPEARLAAQAANGAEAVEEFHRARPDVVFLDIRMPLRDGLDAARELCEVTNPPLLVFVTAYDDYAIKAFETEAIDYLLKPIEAARLDQCIARLRKRLQGGESADKLAARVAQLLGQQVPNASRLRFVRAGAGQTVKLIPIDEVLWFEAEDKYITVATREGDSVIRMALRDLLQQLDPDVFWQIHRGTIVNSRHIAAARRDELGHMAVSMKGRTESLPVSRQFAQLFKQM